MLLVSLTINGTVHRISHYFHNLEHRWNPYIASFTAPQYQLSSEHGGYCRLSLGVIVLNPKLFEGAGDFPPPDQCDITAQWTETNEAAAVPLFQSTCHLQPYDNGQISYEIREPEYTVKLLDTAEDYNGDTVPLPRVFGTVEHFSPVRLPDASGQPTYHLGGISYSNTGVQVTGFTYASAGAATTVHCASAHGYSNGNAVIVNGTVNFNGTHTISNVSALTFDIPVAFPTDNSEILPIRAHAFLAGHLAVYDDGVPISENVDVSAADGTFSLTATPVGQVTVTGTGPQTTLTGIMSWGRTQLGITSYVDTNARGTSPDVNWVETSQMDLIDFLARICETYTHLFDIKSDTLTLVDMFVDNGSDTITEYGFFKKAQYGKFAAVKSITAKWSTHTAETGFVNSDETGEQAHYIKTNDHELTDDLYEYGIEMDITPYHYTRSSIQTILSNILIIMARAKITIPIPFESGMPSSGRKISWPDTSTVQDIDAYLNARSITFDFDNHKIMVTGDGFVEVQS